MALNTKILTFISVVLFMFPENIKGQGIAGEQIDSLIGTTLSVNDSTNVYPAIGDSTKIPALPDSLSGAQQKERQVINAPINYDAFDSMAFSFIEGEQVAYLYRSAKITYGDVELTAGQIEINFKKKEIFAQGILDSVGEMSQKPHFKEGTEEFDCSSLRYNFETGRGFVENVVSNQQDGVVHGEKAKMLSKDVLCMVDGKYSACDAENPHYYLYMTKGKVIGKKAIITGRAYMVVEDFPIYFPFLPYAYIPTQNKSYSSGIIIPSYGEEDTYGFFLKDGGFYWAASDYFDFTVKGDIYSNGSWALKTSSTYKYRYHYSGNVSFSMSRHYTGEVGIDRAVAKNFAITWSHTQDSKANPTSTFSANVNFSTTGNDQLNDYTDYEKSISNQKSSNISYTKRMLDSKVTFTANMRASQQSSDSTVSVSLPLITLNVKSFNPFERKKGAGKKWFYEDIGLSYSANFTNSLSSVKEYDLFSTPWSDWKKGLKHNIGIELPQFTLLDHVNFSPTIDYDETWHFNYIKKYWIDGYDAYDEDNVLRWVPGHIEEINYSGFKRAYSYSCGISASTILYGLYQMKNPNSRIKGIRHKMTPSVSFNYHPDFLSKKQFYDWVQSDSLGTMTRYSYFENNAYTYSGGGMSGSIGFSLSNNLEMKVANDGRDTTSTEAYKKVSIFDNVGFSGSYNLAADTMKLSTIALNVRTKIAGLNLSVSGVLDPYALDSRGARINKYMWNEAAGISKLGRITSASTGFSYSFGSEKMKKKAEEKKKAQGGQGGQGSSTAGVSGPTGGGSGGPMSTPGGPSGSHEEESPFSGYQDFKMPWSISFNYSLKYSHPAFKHTFTQSLSFSGNLDVTDKWKANLNSSYNFKTHKLGTFQMGVTRSLHCWNMSFQFSPVGTVKYYTFTLNANASILKDLKVDKSSYEYNY